MLVSGIVGARDLLRDRILVDLPLRRIESSRAKLGPGRDVGGERDAGAVGRLWQFDRPLVWQWFCLYADTKFPDWPWPI